MRYMYVTHSIPVTHPASTGSAKEHGHKQTYTYLISIQSWILDQTVSEYDLNIPH